MNARTSQVAWFCGASRVLRLLGSQGAPDAAKDEAFLELQAFRLFSQNSLSREQQKVGTRWATMTTNCWGKQSQLWLINCGQPTVANQPWVGDMTYIPILRAGFAYMATLTGRYSRLIVEWSLQLDMSEV